jgi:hypothetical protein
LFRDIADQFRETFGKPVVVRQHFGRAPDVSSIELESKIAVKNRREPSRLFCRKVHMQRFDRLPSGDAAFQEGDRSRNVNLLDQFPWFSQWINKTAVKVTEKSSEDEPVLDQASTRLKEDLSGISNAGADHGRFEVRSRTFEF